MFFRNLSFMHLPQGWDYSAGKLDALLAKHPLTPCTGASIRSAGWVSPHGDDRLVAAHGRQLLIHLGIEQKKVPAAVINKAAKERAAKLEKTQGYKVGKKQMRELKEAIFLELIPRAFPRVSVVRAWLDPVAGYLIADTPTYGKLEEVSDALRAALGEFPCSHVATDIAPGQTMTAWLNGGKAPGRFELDDESELKAPTEDKATVHYKNHELHTEDIRKHIAEGKLVTRLGLIWSERLSLVLTDTLQVKKLKFLDIEKNREESTAQTPDEQFAADFALMSGELASLIGDLDDALSFTPRDKED